MVKLFTFMLLGSFLVVSHGSQQTTVVPKTTFEAIPQKHAEDTQMTEIPLQEIQQRIIEKWEELEGNHSIRIQGTGTGLNHITMEIRSSPDVEHILTNDELDAFKRSLYELAEGKFPLELSVRTCCTAEADIVGTITEWDQEQRQILIVNEDKNIGESNKPQATWVRLSSDGVLIVNGMQMSSGFDKELVGRTVKAWSEGYMNLSYPGQTSALKVVVE